MSQIVTTPLSNETAQRLEIFAHRLGKTISETSALLIEEALREQEFPYIEFRNSGKERQAYLKNSSLAVWEVIRIAKDYSMDEQKTAEHFHRAKEWVRCALLYAEAYPAEIEKATALGAAAPRAVANVQAINQTTLKQLLPQLETIFVSE
ncbi:MAG: transcriptional regulator [Gomphosphaeria aponina SAG 52.96 = DSM 107014]|uniref:Transcriptional regulator n=1 Tax=Gomphosphaeria aponina SAG 52.96 = DSM 107014 TaxID=1521640 RepID=A0A941JS67_9CHRO|nr:transcriptional regulator [Gomphosphaeria aponina SAG 52.96 = DSM 107014]